MVTCFAVMSERTLQCILLKRMMMQFQVSSATVGTWSNHDDNANENVTWKYKIGFLVLLLDFVSIRSTCAMWPNYLGTEQVGMACKLRHGIKNSPSCADVLHKPWNWSVHVVWIPQINTEAEILLSCMDSRVSSPTLPLSVESKRFLVCGLWHLRGCWHLTKNKEQQGCFAN